MYTNKVTLRRLEIYQKISFGSLPNAAKIDNKFRNTTLGCSVYVIQCSNL